MMVNNCNSNNNSRKPSDWGLPDFVILLDILLLALGFLFKNHYLIAAGLILGFTYVSIRLFSFKNRKKMIEKEKDSWRDLK